MALKSTIYKANLSIADIDHSYYEDHQLTLARHPSETDERMMIRLLALAINAYKLQAVCNGDGKLAFGAGLSDPDDPDCSLRDFTGRTRMWIEVGQPEDKPIMKACQKADEVLLYCFNHAAEVWWKGYRSGACPPRAPKNWQSLPSAACSCKPPFKKAASPSAATKAACTLS
jgi:uncharacterized protein YaeQ